MRLGDGLILLVALGCGLMAGFFFAFSAGVMKALSRLSPASGVVAMQSINVAVPNPWFLAVFLGTALGCAAVAVGAFSDWPAPGAGWRLGGSLAYIAGAFLVTILFNVPRNNALAAVEPSSDAAARLWSEYLSVWTAWNHVRTLAALAAAAMLTLSLVDGRG